MAASAQLSLLTAAMSRATWSANAWLRVSGSQNWTGRNPSARSRSRNRLTRAVEEGTAFLAMRCM
jgi:hypothetical protein